MIYKMLWLKILYHLPEGKSDQVDAHAVERACSQAMHIVGIFPIKNIQFVETRTSLKVDMDLATYQHLFDTQT